MHLPLLYSNISHLSSSSLCLTLMNFLFFWFKLLNFHCSFSSALSHTLTPTFHFTVCNRLFFLLLRNVFLLPTCFCPSRGPTLCWTEAQGERNECSLDRKKGHILTQTFSCSQYTSKGGFWLTASYNLLLDVTTFTPHGGEIQTNSFKSWDSCPPNHRDIKTQ